MSEERTVHGPHQVVEKVLYEGGEETSRVVGSLVGAGHELHKAMDFTAAIRAAQMETPTVEAPRCGRGETRGSGGAELMDAAVLHAAVRKLAAHDLDLFLEQRRLYRELVSECAHRGVAVPRRPTRYSDLLERMSASTREPVHNERVSVRKMPPTEPEQMGPLFRPYAGAILEVY